VGDLLRARIKSSLPHRKYETCQDGFDAAQFYYTPQRKCFRDGLPAPRDVVQRCKLRLNGVWERKGHLARHI